MARHNNQQAAQPKVQGGIPEGHALTLAEEQIAHIQDAYSDDRDLINQLLGQVQMAGASEDFFRTVRTSKLAFVKENKLYRALAGKKSPHGAELLNGTWEEFCGLLGRSVDQADRDISNLRAFGEEALENMSRMGIGYREMRQYRRLSDDDKTALIEVAKLGDKESFVELAEEIITKHSKDKEVIAKRAEDAEADLEASRQRVALKETENEKLTGEVLKLKRRIETSTPDEEGAELREEVGRFSYAAEVAIRGDLFQGFTALAEHADKHNCTHDEFMSGCLAQIERALLELRNRFNVKAEPDGQEKPDWVRQFEAEDAAALDGLPSVSEAIGED